MIMEALVLVKHKATSFLAIMVVLCILEAHAPAAAVFVLLGQLIVCVIH